MNASTYPGKSTCFFERDNEFAGKFSVPRIGVVFLLFIFFAGLKSEISMNKSKSPQKPYSKEKLENLNLEN